MEEVTTKVCSSCKRELPTTEFYRNRATKDGLQHHCKECTKIYDARKKSTQKRVISTHRWVAQAICAPRVSEIHPTSIDG